MINTEIIKESISSFISLNEMEWQQLFGFIEVKILKKNAYFLKKGQICESIAFLNSGSMIYYKLLETGKEVTIDFVFKGDWVTEYQSRLNHTPSLLYIKAIEESELVIITNKNLDELYDKVPKLERLGRILTEKAFLKVVQQSIDLQTMSASERYTKLLNEHPEIFQRIPQYHIANYLGIAPKSLSRIRKR